MRNGNWMLLVWRRLAGKISAIGAKVEGKICIAGVKVAGKIRNAIDSAHIM